MNRLGLEFTTDSMATLFMRSPRKDIEIFFDKKRLVWVIRYGQQITGPDAGPDAWGAVHESSTLHGVLDEYVHGEHFS